MNPHLRIARTEVREHLRQPGMLVVMAANYLLFGGAFAAAALLLHAALSDPAQAQLLEEQLAGMGLGQGALHQALDLITSSGVSFVFTTMPLFVAILSGNAILHERTCGTLPFLLLAPITRGQLLRGKLLGVMALPLLMHLVAAALVCLPLGALSTFQPFAQRLGHDPAWWIAYALGVPAASALTGALGTVISGLAQDVRGAMQTTSLAIGTLSLLYGFALVNALSEGPALQLAFAALALVLTLAILALGARLLSRDVQ